jgi:hypothetical protein
MTQALTTDRLSVRMVMDPVEHDIAKAVLHACPGLLVTCSRTADQLDAVALCIWFAPEIPVELLRAMCNKHL